MSPLIHFKCQEEESSRSRGEETWSCAGGLGEQCWGQHRSLSTTGVRSEQNCWPHIAPGDVPSPGGLQPLVQEVSGGWWWAMKMMQCARNTGCFFSCITAVDICWQHHADGQERKLGISVAGHRYPASGWRSQRLAQCDLPACAVPDWHHEARETTSICAETWRLITEACTGKGLINQTHVMWAARACGLVIYPQTPISTRNSSAFWICLSSCMLTRHEIAT